MDFTALHAEFPRNAVSWRAQSLTQAGDKALALAYIDARDVMRRLDEACGPEGWEDSYVETPKGRLICTIRLRVGDDWVSKSDGAGNTDVEGDKGAISDAFKRCAVKWGIGRYLYDIDSPWVPCESKEFNGKKSWKRWTADPWSCVKNAPTRPAQPATIASDEIPASVQLMLNRITEAETAMALKSVWETHFKAIPAEYRALVLEAKDARKLAVDAMALVNA